MSVKYSPFGNSQILDAAGNPAVGWTIGTYTAGSSSRLASYTDSTGLTAQTADIVLNALGLPTNGQIWLTAGSSYKFIVKNAVGVTQFTVDNIAGVNDTGAATVSQWQSSNMTPTFVSTTSFTVPGDQTTELHVGRRLQFTTGAGTVYGIIATTAFGALTTVTMTMDSGQVLDVGLSVVNLSILRNDHSALPGALPGLRSITTFTANGTYTKPTGLQSVRVRLVGGGGGSIAARAGGGAGYAEKVILASAIGATETVTVGAGGFVDGTSVGGNSSFGSHFFAPGGRDGGSATNPGQGGGSLGGGTIGINGRTSTATSGGDSILGFGGTSTSIAAVGYGGGCGTNGVSTGGGTSGIVIVEEYF